MDKKVYYGEYTLKHWIELLLQKYENIFIIYELLSIL